MIIIYCLILSVKNKIIEHKFYFSTKECTDDLKVGSNKYLSSEYFPFSQLMEKLRLLLRCTLESTTCYQSCTFILM